MGACKHYAASAIVESLDSLPALLVEIDHLIYCGIGDLGRAA